MTFKVILQAFSSDISYIDKILTDIAELVVDINHDSVGRHDAVDDVLGLGLGLMMTVLVVC